MAVGAGGALAVVAVLVEETAAALVALGDALGVGGGVDLDASRVLEQRLVFDGPADDLDADGVVRPAVEAGEGVDPLREGLLGGGLDGLALGGGDLLGRVPAHAVVDLALAGNDLVVAVVLEAEGVAVGLDLVLPHLVERGDKLRGRAPGRVVLALAHGLGGAGEDVALLEAADAIVALDGVRQRSVKEGQEGDERKSGGSLHFGQ